MKQKNNKEMKETLTNISVILPVHELNESTEILFGNAIKSIQTQLLLPDELLVVVPSNSTVLKFMKSFDFGNLNVRIIENSGETDFASQMNLGVSNVHTDWFSLLEYDDEYANIWFKNAVTYIKAHQEVDLFLPIVIDVNEKGEFNGFTNEAVWANSFSDELGLLDTQSLLTYQNFNIDGCVMSKDVYETLGGLKPSIKLTFLYEFLLRVTYNDVKVMVIPRFGYKHVNMREGSLFSTYKNTLDPAESKFWLSQAKKEYYFNQDRKITFDEKIA